jgi:hypothetical protein
MVLLRGQCRISKDATEYLIILCASRTSQLASNPYMSPRLFKPKPQWHVTKLHQWHGHDLADPFREDYKASPSSPSSSFLKYTVCFVSPKYKERRAMGLWSRVSNQNVLISLSSALMAFAVLEVDTHRSYEEQDCGVS